MSSFTISHPPVCKCKRREREGGKEGEREREREGGREGERGVGRREERRGQRGGMYQRIGGESEGGS